MDNLPPELILLIFKYLSIRDLMKCRLINKQFKELSEDWSLIDELVINDRIEEFKSYWFYDNKIINYKDAIKWKAFSILKSIYKSDLNNLKRLHYNCVNKLDLNFSELNKLKNLEHLDLKIECKIDGYNYELKLDQLKYLKLNYFNEDYGINDNNKRVIKLKTKNLIALKCYELSTISIENLNKIKYLEVNFNDENEMLNLKDSLENYQCNSVPKLNRDLLDLFPNLIKLCCNLDFSYFDDRDYEEIKDSLKFIIKKKTTLKRSKLRIYYQGVEILNENKINEYEFDYPMINKRLKFQMKNYDLLDDRLAFVYDCNYSELMKLTTTIPNNYFEKYFKIKYCYTGSVIEGPNHFNWFLSNLKQLKFLSANSTSLCQSFYDKLKNTCQLTHLIINENRLILNYNFILDFKLLEHFETNQRFLNSIDLTTKAFKELKYLKYFHFANQNGPVLIQRICENTYTVNCYLCELNCEITYFKVELTFNELMDQLADLIKSN